VLTAVRNGAPYLTEAIANIQSQTFEDWEYIIVDDCSTDRTKLIVERAMRLDSRIRLIECTQSRGPYVAANEGLRVSRGEYIFRTDADDLSPSHRFQRQLDFMAANTQFRACVSFWTPFSERGILPRVMTLPERPRVFKWYLLLRGQSIHSSACIERAALVELGGYRPLPLSQDYRLWCELTRRDWLGIVPEVLSYVRMHENRQTKQQPQLQRDLAIDVLRDHMLALTGELWNRKELDVLWAVGYSQVMPVSRGLAMLDRWESLWRQDPQLTDEERNDLKRLASFRKWKLLRANTVQQPVEVLTNGLKLGMKDLRSLAHGKTAELR
jgi:glycosyltransferase involved in cell wall biosynthesis